MNTDESIDRLNRLLPLFARQQALGAGYVRLHRAILRYMLKNPVALDVYATADMAAEAALDEAAEEIIHTLVDKDLVVSNEDRTLIVGAYPLTTETTKYRLSVDGVQVRAMCALAAVSVAPMFGVTCRIRSACHMSGQLIDITMDHDRLIATNLPAIHVGVSWQMPSGAAAHSMCMDMVFLKDAGTATAWQGDDSDSASIYRLEGAIAFGAGYFDPLLEEQVILSDDDLVTV